MSLCQSVKFVHSHPPVFTGGSGSRARGGLSLSARKTRDSPRGRVKYQISTRNVGFTVAKVAKTFRFHLAATPEV
jgi:hypothetical protein